MKRVKVVTVGESIQATERDYIEFCYYQSPSLSAELVGEPYKSIDADVRLAPVHRICELGKPDVLLAIEPKLYDLITDIKINDLRSAFNSEQSYRKQLEKDVDKLITVRDALESSLDIQNKRIGCFNDLPWWKRIFRKV